MTTILTKKCQEQPTERQVDVPFATSVPINPLRMSLKETDLRHENETKRDGGAEDDEEPDDEVGGVLLVLDDEGDGDAADAHDEHVVDAHPDVLGVVESRDADPPRLPGQEAAEDLSRS